MSESLKRIDARGLPCPGPVVEAKKTLDAGGFDVLELLVDNMTAQENVCRFVTHAGHRIAGIDREGETTIIRIQRSGGGEEADQDLSKPDSPEAVRKTRAGVATILIARDVLGAGNDELGALLMRGFIKTLLDAEELPARIILMNGGVRLAVEGAVTLGSLRELEAGGMEILACGTCLDYFGLKESLSVGRVSNMFEISSFLLAGETLSL